MDNPTQINRVTASQSLLYNKISCMNKKRKFPAEQLGLPLPKHKCSSSYSFEFSSLSNANPEVLNPYQYKGETSERSGYDISHPTSGHGSNSFSRDVDSIMTTSESFDQPSTSYSNFEKSVYSLESRSDKMESLSSSSCIGMCSSPINEDHPLEFESHEDYSCAEYPIEPCDDKELEDLLSAANPNNLVLSSGRWNVNQDTDQGAEKLTIDKEFEQYFSMLML